MKMPLTSAEIQQMQGMPVWCEELSAYGIIVIDQIGPWANNGVCAQVVTQEVFQSWSTYAPIMSKKMFKDMKKLGFLYTNDELKSLCLKNHHADYCTYYAFDIPAMIQAGYNPISEE